MNEKIVVFGGTGDVGKIVVEKFIALHKRVCVLTRQLKTSEPNLTYSTGNVLDFNAVEKCIGTGDGVVIALGFNDSSPETMSKGTLNIIAAMKKNGATRVVCLSAQGTGDSWNDMPDDFKKIVLNDEVLKSSFRDHSIQERLIKDSGLDWTIVRPTEIVSGRETSTYLVNKVMDSSSFKISNLDVAQFIVTEVMASNYLRTTVMITD